MHLVPFALHRTLLVKEKNNHCVQPNLSSNLVPARTAISSIEIDTLIHHTAESSHTIRTNGNNGGIRIMTNPFFSTLGCFNILARTHKNPPAAIRFLWLLRWQRHIRIGRKFFHSDAESCVATHKHTTPLVISVEPTRFGPTDTECKRAAAVGNV